MKKTAFLVNRRIRRYHRIIRDIERVFGEGFEYLVFTSEYARHTEAQAAEAVRDGFDHLVAVGGDGTVSEVLNGMIQGCRLGDGGAGPDAVDWEKMGSLTLGVYPAGSGNDFARMIDTPKDMVALREKLLKGFGSKVDIGWARFRDAHQRDQERCFLNIADVGMGGLAVQHMEQRRIAWLPAGLNYTRAILHAFASYRRSRVRWKSEAGSWEGRLMSLVVANGRYFGSGLGIAPTARIDDGCFSMVTLADIRVKDYLLHLHQIKACRPVRHPQVRYDEAVSLEVVPQEDQQLPIEMDGEFVGFCPMEVRCIPSAVTILSD